MGSWVTVRSRAGWVGETGLVVGPDQRWFPRPHSVFVKFGSGLTLLIAVTDLTVVAEAGEEL